MIFKVKDVVAGFLQIYVLCKFCHLTNTLLRSIKITYSSLDYDKGRD